MPCPETFLCEATDEDIDELVEVNRLDAAASFRDGIWDLKKIEWKEEEPYENFTKGGPWLHPMTLRVHFQLMKEIGSIWLLKDQRTEQVIGEADVAWSPEPQPLGNLLYLTWITIFPTYRGQGLGTRFLSEVIEKEITKHPTADYFDSIPEDNISRGLYQSVELKKWKEILSFEIQLEEIRGLLEHSNFEISERSLKEPPYNLLNCGRAWYPTAYSWRVICYSQQFNELFRNEQWKTVKAYNLFWHDHLIVVTDARNGYLWMEPEIARDIEAYALALKAMKALAKNRDPKRESIGFDVFKENLSYFLSKNSRPKIETVSYMRRRILTENFEQSVAKNHPV